MFKRRLLLKSTFLAVSRLFFSLFTIALPLTSHAASSVPTVQNAYPRDVLARFTSSPIAALAGYSTPDGVQHVLVGTADTNVTEIYWSPGGRVHWSIQ